MKTLYPNVVAAVVIISVMLGCCPERKAAQNWNACVTTCHTNEDAILTHYRACLDGARRAYNSVYDSCDALHNDDLTRACRMHARESYERQIAACEEALEKGLSESRMCVIECTKIKDPPQTN